MAIDTIFSVKVYKDTETKTAIYKIKYYDL